MCTLFMSGSSSLCRPHLKFRCPHTFSHMCMFHLLQWLLIFLWATLFEAWFHHTSACQRWIESLQCCCLFSDKSLPRRPEVPFVSGKIKSSDSTWDLPFEKQVVYFHKLSNSRKLTPMRQPTKNDKPSVWYRVLTSPILCSWCFRGYPLGSVSLVSQAVISVSHQTLGCQNVCLRTAEGRWTSATPGSLPPSGLEDTSASALDIS